MQKIHWIHDLFQHMEWADAYVWESVFKLETLETDPRLDELLYHIHSVQHVFLQVWENQPVIVAEPSGFPHLTAISQWGHEYYQKLSSYLNEVDEAALEKPSIVPWAAQVEKYLGRPAHPTTLADTMIQVTTHTAYHRGQINALLRKLNVQPPLVDYIAWIWAGKPEASWPEAVSN